VGVRGRSWAFVGQTSNTQPFELTWNVMGMGNNPHFKVNVHPYQTSEGEPALWFEHPTIAGPGAGGWMIKPIEDFPVGTKTLSFKEPPAGHAEWQKELSNNAAYSPLAMRKGTPPFSLLSPSLPVHTHTPMEWGRWEGGGRGREMRKRTES